MFFSLSVIFGRINDAAKANFPWLAAPSGYMVVFGVRVKDRVGNGYVLTLDLVVITLHIPSNFAPNLQKWLWS